MSSHIHKASEDQAPIEVPHEEISDIDVTEEEAVDDFNVVDVSDVINGDAVSVEAGSQTTDQQSTGLDNKEIN